MSKDLGVFTRNWGRFLSAAADTAAIDPDKLVTFRSRVPWKSAAEALRPRDWIPIYMAVIDGGSYVTFDAKLRRVLVRPALRARETHRMLQDELETTRGDGLWGGDVQTLYAIYNCRQIQPFPQSALVKHDGRGLHRNYTRSYAVVQATRRVAVALVPIASDSSAPPRRVRSTTDRIVRNTGAGKKLKRLYNNCCQYCDDTITIAGGRSYSEGHHPKPLGLPYRGVDHPSSIIILCPNHHAQCDMGGLRLTWSDLIVDRRHGLSKKYVAYHNRRLTSPERQA